MEGGRTGEVVGSPPGVDTDPRGWGTEAWRPRGGPGTRQWEWVKRVTLEVVGERDVLTRYSLEESLTRDGDAPVHGQTGTGPARRGPVSGGVYVLP